MAVAVLLAIGSAKSTTASYITVTFTSETHTITIKDTSFPSSAWSIRDVGNNEQTGGDGTNGTQKTDSTGFVAATGIANWTSPDEIDIHMGTESWTNSIFAPYFTVTTTVTVGPILSDQERIPEPSTFALLAAGAISLLAYAWRRRAA